VRPPRPAVRGAANAPSQGQYGGEEFVVLLPETSSEEAVLAADKLRGMLSATPVTAGAISIPIHASIGVASWSDAMRTSGDLYAAADEALYRAKELGRDRTELHDPLATRS
jgi:diguanylate cyclase (GGDEF)-like protein